MLHLPFQLHWHDVLYWLVFSVVFQNIILKSVAKLLSDLLKKMFIKTERDAIIYFHYMSKVLRRGHDKHHLVCVEGTCVKVK